jgi:hypothetical protein
MKCLITVFIILFNTMAIAASPCEVTIKWQSSLWPDWPILSKNQIVYAIDMSNISSLSYYLKSFDDKGQLIWQRKLTDGKNFNGLSFSPDKEFLYFHSTHTIYKYNLEGQEIWSSDYYSNLSNYPVSVANNGMLIVIDGYNEIFALDEKGKIKWTANIDKSDIDNLFISPIDDSIYAFTSSDKIYAYNKEGEPKWIYHIKTDLKVTPLGIGEDGTIYFKTNDYPTKVLYALNPDKSIKWSLPLVAHKSKPHQLANAIDSDGHHAQQDMAIRHKSQVALINHETNLRSMQKNTIYIQVAEGEQNFAYAINVNGTVRWYSEITSGGDRVSEGAKIGHNGWLYFLVNHKINVLDQFGDKIMPAFNITDPVKFTIGDNDMIYTLGSDYTTISALKIANCIK